ncbi:MAG TPA: HD domain-containing phosphohydrolase [Pirellulales bacterium]|nr:HD domain-containing phosphohydrolase [Pirellulales bacterium]
MRRLVTYLGVGVIAQVACVAVGLWMHDRFLLLTATSNAEQKAAAALIDAAEPVARSARNLDFTDEAAHAELGRRVRQAPLPHGAAWLVVGPDWRVRDAYSPAAEPAPKPGDALAWTMKTYVNQNPFADPVEGFFATDTGPQLAVGFRLPGESGLLVAYQAADSVALLPGELGESMPLVALITFLWLSGLLSMCTFMSGKRLSDELVGELAESEDRALRREQALLRTRDAVIFGLAKLAESRDTDTGEHVERISLYCQRLSAAMRRRPEYRDVATPTFIKLIEASSVLHDIGKVGIADAILHKPGPLTVSERAEIQKHAMIGSECLVEIERRLGASNFLQMAREIAHCHHERWDGKGYPSGLRGEDIPLAARIVAIADNYDALVSRRPYKEPFPHEKVVSMIREGAGTQFDPKLVEIFLEIEPEFRDIAEQYATAARRPPPPEKTSEHEASGQRVERQLVTV